MKNGIEELLSIIKEYEITSLQELIDMEVSSESTIRRRLKELSEIGYIEILSKGNFKLINDHNLSLQDEYKLSTNRKVKEDIGERAASLVPEGSDIFIDNGTTVRYILKYLKDKDVIVYTNGFHHINEANKFNITMRLIPGEILFKEASLVGVESISYLNNFKFDYVFIGANGFSKTDGVTTPNYEEAILKKAALKTSLNSYILLENNKNDKVFKYKVCNVNDYEIITNV